MKKIIFSALGTAIFLSVCVFGASDTSEHWANDYITQAESENWIDMRSDGSFNPDMYATRQETAYMLYMSQRDSLDESKKAELGSFIDSQQIDEKYAEAIRVLAGNGIINGYNDGTFRPLSNVTRAELSVMVSSFISVSKPLNSNHFGYNDAELIPKWAESYITKCTKAGLIKGYSDNTFRANNNVTRAEAVTMIVNLENFNYVETTTETTTSDTLKVIRPETSEETSASENTKVVRTRNIELNKTNQTTESSRIITKTSTTTEAASEATTSQATTSKSNSDDDEIDLFDISTVEYDEDKAEELAELINNKRTENGVNVINLDESLCKIATLKAMDMKKTGALEDNSDTYGGVEEMLSKFDIRYRRAYQTFASGVELPYDVISILENDTSSENSYITSGYEDMGIGYYQGYWSLIYKE